MRAARRRTLSTVPVGENDRLARALAVVEQSGQQRRARHNGAVALQWPAVGEIEQGAWRSRPGTTHEHDDQQQRGVEEGGPGDQRCGEFRQHGQDDGAEQRAGGSEPRPPIRMAMKNNTLRSKVNASGVM